MRYTVVTAGVLVLGSLSAGCGVADSDQGAGGDNSRFPANEQIGPVHLHVPEEWTEFPVEDSGEGWIVGYSEDQDGTAEEYVSVRTDFQGAGSVGSAQSVISGELEFRQGGQVLENRGDGDEIEGADEGGTFDFTWEGDRGEVNGRMWVLGDSSSGTIAGVEYAGYDVDEEELDAFGETLELRPEEAGD